MNVLIVGSSNIVAGKFLELFSSSRYNTYITYDETKSKPEGNTRNTYLNITDKENIKSVIDESRPELVIYTLNQDCNIENETWFDGLNSIIELVSEERTKLVLFSNSSVFSLDQEPSPLICPVDPSTELGQWSLRAESLLKESYANHIILRTGYLYGFSANSENNCHLTTSLAKFRETGSLDVANDRFVYPTLVDDATRYMNSLIKSDEKGIFHFSGEEKVLLSDFIESFINQYTQNRTLKPMDGGEGLACDIKLKNSLIPSDLRPTSYKEGLGVYKKQRGCLFRMIYSVRPDMKVADHSSANFRIACGKKLQQESPVPEDVDVVVPIPESGIFSATGVAAEARKPFMFGIIRDYFTKKTLYSASSKERSKVLLGKLIPVKEIVENKKIVLVDEAVLSGLTLSVVIKALRESGAREIHVRIPSPIMYKECTGRVLPKVELIYDEYVKQNLEVSFQDFLKSYFEVESFEFLSQSAFTEIVSDCDDFCSECFSKSISI